MSSHDIADRNVERLLNVAYKPEPIDPAFVVEIEEKLLAAGRESTSPKASLRALGIEPDANLLRLRRRLSWAMGAAAAFAACVIGYYAATRPTSPSVVRADRNQAPAIPANARTGWPGLTAKPRPDAATPQSLEIGATLTTAANERRRVALADGSILYVNENTALTQTAARQLRVERGEVYVEVAPRTGGEQFVVATPDRTVTALGTHFHVAALATGSSVLVTQGTVKVSDVPGDVPAGQQLKPGSKQATTAPRASHVLDWLKPLVAAADGKLVPTCQHEGGALIAIDPNGQELQLSMRKYHIDVHIEDGFARTTIDQTYFNNTYSRLEGTFYFPLPPDASLSRLAMYVLDGKDQKLMEGGMAERDHARNTFETIRYERRDPALLEWVDGSTFKMRVFPLEAWQEKRIILSYTQRLPWLYGVTKYRFPGGHNMQVVRDWSFAANVANAKAWDVLTPSHPDMKRSDGGTGSLTLNTGARFIKPEQDVVLELREREAPPDGAGFATHLQDGQRYFMVRYRPKLDTKPQRERRDWIVVVETSANRDPLLARAQIEVFRNLFKNVEYDDTLALMTCNTRVTEFAKPQAATSDNVKAAVEFLEKSHLIGGCDLEQALRKALVYAKDAKNPHIVHIGAGVPTLGEIKDDVLAKLIPDEVRYIGVGVGKKWNRSLMKQAADRTGGYFTQINPDEPIAWRAFDLVATLNTPRLLDVRVVDPNEKVTYLADVVTLAQGEEICAFTRGPSGQFDVPSKVIVSGKLDGKPFRREIEVGKGQGGVGYIPAPDAGYLPRTWAKLEIDRLMAGGQDKNKAAITELSKQMYVMSPFTSLLVLESEADYKRFNIDRGRKDHWAMYATPERIPQVYEPDPAYQAWWRHVEQPKDGAKPSEEQVLDTILMRLPPQVIYASGRQYHVPPTATARQVLMSSYAMPIEIEYESIGQNVLGDFEVTRHGAAERNNWWAFDTLDLKVKDKAFDFERIDSFEFAFRKKASSRLGGLPYLERLQRNAGLRDLVSDTRLLRRSGVSRLRSRRLFEEDELAEANFLGRATTWGLRREPGATELLLEELEARESASRPVREAETFLRSLDQPRGLSLGRFLEPSKARKPIDRDAAWLAGRSLELDLMISSLDGVNWPAGARDRFANEWSAELAGQVQSRQAPSWVVYSRPQFQVDQRLFGDLTIYAPGLSTSWADVQNTVHQEAQRERQAAPGKIDDAARALFQRARQVGWHTIAHPGLGRIPGVAVSVNGQGQFAYQRTLASGLIEQVVCDGQTLWHVYPEIGLGARRPFSRFHFGELSQWAPWVLPPIEDLAHGADLQAVNENTVALVAHRAPGKDRPSPTTPLPKGERGEKQLHFVFGADGALVELRIVETPECKVLARQTFDASGTIRLLDGAGKQLAERKLPRAASESPNLNPKLDELVVLDMPLRTTGYWDRRIQQLRADAKAQKDEAVLQAAYVALFASSCFVRDRDSLPMFGAYLHAKGDKRLGFYTLLSARETHFQNQPNTWAPGIAAFDPVVEHPNSPLARYLVHHQKNQRVQHEADAKFLDNLPGPKDGFIARLTAFRNAWNAWRHYQLVGNNAEVQAREKRKLIEFVGVNTSPLFAFLLQSNMHQLNTHDRADISILIYESQKDLVHPLGMGYVFGYDAAHHRYYKGEYKEASKLMRELHAQAVKEGVLPKIDGTFRAILDDARSGGPNFGEYLRGLVHGFLNKNQPHLAVLTAMQASYVGNRALGDELFQHIQQRMSAKTDPIATLAALEYVVHNGLDSRADFLRDRLLADAELAGRSTVWRLSAALAQQRGQTKRAVTDLEKALDLEYQQMGELINLEAVRRDYRELLGQYLEVAKAAQTLEQEAPQDLQARVVRAADRWRSVDSEPREVAQTTAKILKLLGAKDLAWDYLTTPVALKPNEAAPWTDLAVVLRGDGDLALADHAYARAFISESTNPQILWDRAQNLLQLDRVEEARRLWRQIADGVWQERFQGLVPQARWHLEHN